MTDRPDQPRPEEAEESGRPTVRDKRRIDPETYQLRQTDVAAPAEGATGAPVGGPAADQPGVERGAEEIAGLKQQVADRTMDLQRVQAEYVNYKRRVDRDRDLARSAGVESVILELLPVMDNLRSAREHEELSGGFKAIAEEIEKLAGKHGLAAFGEAGDPFDPHIHEALMHAEAENITVPTCVTILQPGYRLRDRVIRPARVAVAQPDAAAAEPAAAGGAAAESASAGGPAAQSADDPQGRAERADGQ